MPLLLLRTTRPPLLASAAVLLAAALSCSKEEPYTVEQFVSEYTTAYCNYVFKCCKTGQELSFNSKATCEQLVDESAKEVFAYHTAGSDFATYDEAAAKSCVDTLQKTSCTDSTLLAGCITNAVHAVHTYGDDCTYSSECDSSYCIQTQKGTKGYCGQKSSNGGGCSGDSRACPSGTYCSATRVCSNLLAEGVTCDREYECESGICSATYKQCLTAQSPMCDGK
jgi:hypothetical protein